MSQHPFPPSDLRRPTDYKARYERAEHKRMHLERLVESRDQEIKALKWDLQETRRALALAEAELRRRGMTPQDRQGNLIALGA